MCFCRVSRDRVMHGLNEVKDSKENKVEYYAE